MNADPAVDVVVFEVALNGRVAVLEVGGRPRQGDTMVHSSSRILIVAVCLLTAACADDAATRKPARAEEAIEGLWTGSWGGGQRDGVVFQPVIAEMVVQGDRIELHGFRNVGRLTGTVQLDAGARRMRITPAAKADEKRPRPLDYTYEIKGDKLTLTDSDKVAITLHKHRVVKDPLANAQVELVTATGINEAGDLLVTEYTVLRAGRAGTTYYQPEPHKRSTKQAAVFVVREAGLKKVTVDEARRLLGETTPVVVTYRHDDRPPPQSLHELWKEMGSPQPDSEALGRTFARLLRPGSLIFVLSARENVPQP
jgi:hypothetical protein